METEYPGQVKRKNMSNDDVKIEEKKPRKQYDRTGKNSLQVLSLEFNPHGTQAIDFHFESIGGSGNPSYKAMAEIEGSWFEGVGTSKMIAKRLLASKALAQLRSIFISPDYPNKETGTTAGGEKNPLQKPLPNPMQNPLQNQVENPLMTLNREFGGGKSIDFQLDCLGTPQNPSYKAVAQIDGVWFEAVGTSKLLAKRALACTALARL